MNIIANLKKICLKFDTLNKIIHIKLEGGNLKVIYYFIITALLFQTNFSQNVIHWSKKPNKDWPNIAMINNVEYKNPKFNNEIAGCAFLIEYKGDTLAVTCKHSLWVAKSDKMKYVDFEGSLKSWVMHPKNDLSKKIIADELININNEELIGENNLNSDWLIFKIKENKTDIKPLTIRSSPLIKGEKLFEVGWSFKDKTGPQRVNEYTYHKTIGEKILVEDVVKTNETGAGLSGSPIIDQNGELVGITSNFTIDPENQQYYKSPNSTKYLMKILKEKVN